MLQLGFVIEGADRIWLELTDYGFGQESLWINIRRSKHGSRVVASTLDHAEENNYGIPAFNVNNLEQVQAIMQAADEVNAPVIMQASAGARKYAGEVFLEHLIKAAIESYPHIPVCMHQDHGQSPAVCQGAINLGFSSVMMDGSLMSDGKTISTFDYNVNVTKEVVNMAHKVGVSVEGELGCLGSLETMKGDKEDGHGTDAEMTRDQLLTDPDQAAQFVRRNSG